MLRVPTDTGTGIPFNFIAFELEMKKIQFFV